MVRPQPPGAAPVGGAAAGSETASGTAGARTSLGGVLPVAEVARVVGRIDAATPFVVVASTPTPGTTWVADVIASAQAGGDPLEPWRSALRRQQQRQAAPTQPESAEQPEQPETPARTARLTEPGRAGSARSGGVPLHLPAAFVLQWWCEIIATPIAYAAGLGPWVLEPEARALGFELAVGLYPSRIVVRPEHTSLRLEPVPDRRWQRARGVYDALVTPVAAGFAPEVRMGTRQRWGVVDDMWQTAARRAAGAAGESVGPEPVRTSCCFIFRLPGMQECTSCPRGGRR